MGAVTSGDLFIRGFQFAGGVEEDVCTEDMSGIEIWVCEKKVGYLIEGGGSEEFVFEREELGGAGPRRVEGRGGRGRDGGKELVVIVIVVVSRGSGHDPYSLRFFTTVRLAVTGCS